MRGITEERLMELCINYKTIDTMSGRIKYLFIKYLIKNECKELPEDPK